MKSTRASSKVFKRTKVQDREMEQPYGSLQNNVSRVRVAKTKIPVEARSAERLAQMGNIVTLDKKYVEDVRSAIEVRAKKFRDTITKTVVTTSVGLDQALDWSLVMLKDGLNINSSVSVDILHLLEAASNVAMMEHITTSLGISKTTRTKLLGAVIEKSVEHAYAGIEKAKGMTRQPNPGLAGLVTDPRVRYLLRQRDGAQPKIKDRK